MDASHALSSQAQTGPGAADTRRQNLHHSSRNIAPPLEPEFVARPPNGADKRHVKGSATTASPVGYTRGSPAKKDQKHVCFQLIDTDNPHIQARLPMRVMISTHDTTESIITTLKNFYGLYDYGVSFETKEGVSIIAAYNNFENDMTVYVRTVAQPPSLTERNKSSASPKRPSLGPAFEMRPPLYGAAQSPTRSAPRSAGVRSMSPQSDAGRYANSAYPGGKTRPLKSKSKENSIAEDAEGYSSGAESVTSSRRSKAEEIKADITVDNIVEGGRRKRAFESSELPLFVPPQVPISASISSISPQRRSGPPNGASPYTSSHQQTFSYQQALPSPQSYGAQIGYTYSGLPSNAYQNTFQPPNRQLRGGRTSGTGYGFHRAPHGVLPTPDPTIGSVISDEDVALQLMRLGDPTAFSHGRTSTSTVDDALSGKADAASSDEEDSEEEDDKIGGAVSSAPQFSNSSTGPQRKRQRLMNELPSGGTSGEEYEDHQDGTFRAERDRIDHDPQRKFGKVKSKSRASVDPLGPSAKSGKPRALSMNRAKKAPLGGGKTPMSPASLPTQSRKASISSLNFQHQLGEDEEDLSAKPRCQRCRKSKKGCDRQRPCGRCKDAGIGADGCVSEDEGNGRKGRYGRHMGVTIKKSEETIDDTPPPQQQPTTLSTGYFLAPALPDKGNKKRKR